MRIGFGTLLSLLVTLLATASMCAMSFAAEPPASQPAITAGGARTWRLPEEHFQLQMPGTFEKRTGKDEQHTVLLLRSSASRGPAKLHDVFNIEVAPLRDPAHPPSLDELVQSAQKKATQLHPEAKFEPVQKLTVDGAPAAAYAFTCTVSGHDAKEFRVFTVSHDRFYLLCYLCEASAGDEAEQLLKRMIETFHWVD
jgi:hypothetical protein